MLYVLVFYRGYSKEADFVTEIGFLLKHVGGGAGIRLLINFPKKHLYKIKIIWGKY